MTRKVKYLASMIVIAILLFIILNTQSYAATANLKVSSTSVTVGDTITISVTGNAASWQLSLSGPVSQAMADVTQTGENENVTMGTYTYKTTQAGTVTFTLTGKAINSDYSEQTINETKKVEVKAAEEKPPVTPEQPTTPEQPEQPTNPQQPTTPTVTEPKFTSVNRTMYATGDINLRSSWSTSSSATKVTKGTELTVTGTSSDKVNGYVWYRVNYNGATKYVASSLLTNTKPEEKSNNANLKSLTVAGEEFLPVFDKETTSYTMKVAEEVTKLEVKAEAEDEKATVTIKGNDELKEGENTVTITVTAEDGTTKNYEIKVTKVAGEVTKLGLQTLTIKDTSIARMFKPDVYEYEIDINDVTSLEIEAIANDETATVEILGNEDLKEGENIITIIVSAGEGEEKVTYQIKANKILKAAKETKQIDSKIYFYAGIGALILVALIIVIIYTIKHRNQDEYEYTDNVDELPEELPERQEKKEPKIDYFLDEEEKSKNKKGKHF